MTPEEFKAMQKATRKAKRIATEKAGELHDLVEDRLPAHGIKPPIMTELFELEDAREVILRQLEALKGAVPDN